MRKTALLATFLAAGCGQGSGDAANQAANRAVDGRAPAPARVQTATLTGLYEGSGRPPSQICIAESDGRSRFGLTIRTNGSAGCGGSGVAVRAGDILRLAMEGEEPCVIEARIQGTRVTFPRRIPAACAYYCASDASMRSAVFVKTGGTREDAARALDVVSDPLCG